MSSRFNQVITSSRYKQREVFQLDDATFNCKFVRSISIHIRNRLKVQTELISQNTVTLYNVGFTWQDTLKERKLVSQILNIGLNYFFDEMR